MKKAETMCLHFAGFHQDMYKWQGGCNHHRGPSDHCLGSDLAWGWQLSMTQYHPRKYFRSAHAHEYFAVLDDRPTHPGSTVVPSAQVQVVGFTPAPHGFLIVKMIDGGVVCQAACLTSLHWGAPWGMRPSEQSLPRQEAKTGKPKNWKLSKDST